MIKDKRLGIFKDIYGENAFVVKTTELVFARIYKVSNAWYVWFYKRHIQRSYPKLREAISSVEKDFIKYIEGCNK